MAKEHLAEFDPKLKEKKEEGSIHKVSLREPLPPVTNYRAAFTRMFVLLCIVIFLITFYQTAEMFKSEKKTINPLFPVIAPIQRQLLYDNPSALALMKEFNEKYPNIASEKEVPSEALALYNKIKSTPTWSGVYPILVGKKESPAPLFTNIREGEVWRIITPIFLHANLLHILFNMLWLWFLGKMVEHNIGVTFYLLFVIVTAAITNTAQYLMSGPYFMGFSGVLAAMAGFIWVRKKKAPWEAYPIDFATLSLLGIFIFGLLALQIIVFILQFLHIITFELPFANTAHIVGVFAGMGLGNVKLLKSK